MEVARGERPGLPPEPNDHFMRRMNKISRRDELLHVPFLCDKLLGTSKWDVRKHVPPTVAWVAGAGDEARTRDVLLGKEVLYH